MVLTVFPVFCLSTVQQIDMLWIININREAVADSWIRIFFCSYTVLLMMKTQHHQVFEALQVNQMPFWIRAKYVSLICHLLDTFVLIVKFYRCPTRRPCPRTPSCWFVSRTTCCGELQCYRWWSWGAPAATWCPKLVLARLVHLILAFSPKSQLGREKRLHIVLFCVCSNRVGKFTGYSLHPWHRGKKKMIVIQFLCFDLQFWLRKYTFMSRGTCWWLISTFMIRGTRW